MSDRPLRTWRHFLMIALLVLPLSGWAQSYVGKVCMISTVTTRQQGPVTPERFLLDFDVTNLGGTSYSVAGALLSPPDQPMVATGAGTVVGGDLYLNVVMTQAHADGWMDTSINRTRISLATMTGTFYEIGNDFNTVTRVYDHDRYTAGTVELSLAACPR